MINCQVDKTRKQVVLGTNSNDLNSRRCWKYRIVCIDVEGAGKDGVKYWID